MSPTQRALAECKRRGWTVQIVERWNQYARVRQDLFGVIDLLAIVPPGTEPGYLLGIQVTSGSGHSARRTKILAEPRARLWVQAGASLAVWSFAKRGARGKRKTWALREETISRIDMEAV